MRGTSLSLSLSLLGGSFLTFLNGMLLCADCSCDTMRRVAQIHFWIPSKTSNITDYQKTSFGSFADALRVHRAARRIHLNQLNQHGAKYDFLLEKGNRKLFIWWRSYSPSHIPHPQRPHAQSREQAGNWWWRDWPSSTQTAFPILQDRLQFKLQIRRYRLHLTGSNKRYQVWSTGFLGMASFLISAFGLLLECI